MLKLKNAIVWIITVTLLIATGYGLYLLERGGLDVWLVILLAYFAGTSLFIMVVYSQHRHPMAKMAWMVVMIILPFFGFVMFIIFGRRFPNRVPQIEFQSGREFKYEDLEDNKNVKASVENLFTKQKFISRRGVYDGNFDFMRDGTKAFNEMFKDMRKAKKFINIHYYIIHPGEIYDEFKDILIKKAGEGVEIRLIVDDFGRWAMPWYEIKELEAKGVKVQVFGKVSFPFINSENGYRTHRKCVIIDGETVHTGGLNIGDEYANMSKKYGQWIDLQYRITGRAVKSYNLLFIQDWRLISGEVMGIERYELSKPGGKSQSILVPDGPQVKEAVLANSLINWIRNAKEEIHIASPYFIPTSHILFSLATAVRSGVKVVLYIPGKADKNTVLVATRYWAKELQAYGAEIRSVNDMFIHSKIGMFDGEYAYAGTANIDMRSLYSQFEFVNLITGPAVEGVKNIFDHYESMSTIITPAELKTSRLRDRIRRVFAMVVAPLM